MKTPCSNHAIKCFMCDQPTETIINNGIETCTECGAWWRLNK